MIAASIAGATGLTGSHVLNLLLDDGGFDPVFVNARKPLGRNHPRLRESGLDFRETPSLDVAFCCLGTTIKKAGSQEAFQAIDHRLVCDHARWAKRCGARHYLVISSVMSRKESPNFYLRVKAEMEAELETIGFESLDIFQPSFLLGARAEKRPGERAGQMLVELVQFAMLGPLERFRGVSAETLARAMAAQARAARPGVHRHEWAAIIEAAER